MGLVYRTNSWSGYGKGDSSHYEYFDDGETVTKVKVHEFKFFDGHENSRERDEKEVASWSHDDPDMPDWLREKLDD